MMESSTKSALEPDLRRGIGIFASRPVSLVAALIAGVVIAVVSFMLLFFPATAGYYFAVGESRRETYFIDLNNVLRTVSLVWIGLRRTFGASFVLGIFGVLPAAALFLVPIIPLEIGGEHAVYYSLGLQILWLPSSFLLGAILLYGYPYLIATNHGFGALAYAIGRGRTRPLLCFFLGFAFLFPPTAFPLHLLMVFTYPLLAASAVAGLVKD